MAPSIFLNNCQHNKERVITVLVVNMYYPSSDECILLTKWSIYHEVYTYFTVQFITFIVVKYIAATMLNIICSYRYGTQQAKRGSGQSLRATTEGHMVSSSPMTSPTLTHSHIYPRGWMISGDTQVELVISLVCSTWPCTLLSIEVVLQRSIHTNKVMVTAAGYFKSQLHVYTSKTKKYFFLIETHCHDASIIIIHMH